MKMKLAMCLSIFTINSGYAWAAAPVLHASDTVTIDASASKVWHAIKDFNALNTWHPGVATDAIVSGANNTVGAVRLLTLKGGGTVKEKLLAFDGRNHSFKYSILESVLPVSDYTSVVVVKSLDSNKSSVTWSGRFKRKNTGENPADNESDKAALDTANAIYSGGLDNLKKIIEGK